MKEYYIFSVIILAIFLLWWFGHICWTAGYEFYERNKCCIAEKEECRVSENNIVVKCGKNKNRS